MFKHNDSLLFLNCTQSPTIKNHLKLCVLDVSRRNKNETKQNIKTKISLQHNLRSLWFNLSQQQYKELVAITSGDNTQIHII